jgi:hypothetical protein
MVIGLLIVLVVIYVNAVTLSPARVQIIAIPHHLYSLNNKGARRAGHCDDQGAVSRRVGRLAAPARGRRGSYFSLLQIAPSSQNHS